ncbi:MAG TPA: hypothetical protein VJN43_02605 [Bryobacteraceae bacterium]|nr:hypothetical protein [Bryobacteraceae bacterium]
MNGFGALLANAAFFYPLYWLAMFVVRAAPALLHVALLGHRLLVFQFGPLWVQAACCPPGPFAVKSDRGESATLAIVLMPLVAAATFFLVRRRLLAGIMLASLGQIAIIDPLFRLLFWHRYAPVLVVSVVIYSAILLGGLLLVTSAAEGGYLGRLTAALVLFCLPLAIFSAFLVRFGASPAEIAVVIGPALALSAIAALRKLPAPCGAAQSFSLRRFGAGVVASLVLIGALKGSQAAHQRSEQAARLAFLAAAPKPNSVAPYPKLFFQKGVNFTAEGPVGYDPQSAAPLLDELKTYGVDAIALVPYGFASSREPAIGYGRGGMERSEDIEIIAALAHLRGMKVLLKPQLWTHGGFPGNIEFSEPHQRAQWFAQYRKFLAYYAALAKKIHADLFSVGVELGKMTPYESDWRSLIACAREIYPGPLVYSATQGPEFETIRFWDALDYIGLNEYYPLPDNLATADLLRKVEAVHDKFSRPVIFTEAGFPSFAHPNRAPWDETPRALVPSDQARCYDAVLTAFYSKPWFQGVYWWKVGTNGFGGPEDGSHTPWGKPAMDVVKRWYLHGGR